MDTKEQFYLTEKKRDLPKQIGCMYGIFQLFDRYNSLTSRRTSFQNKRLLLGAQHHLDPQNVRKEVQEKQRVFKDSSSCSTALSSLNSTKQKTVPHSPSHIADLKENISVAKGVDALNLRDVVMGSMNREVRVVPIKIQNKDERKGHVLKHVDSPRPLQQSKSRKQEAVVYDGQTHILPKCQQNVKISKEERLVLPRFSYDERESREAIKSSIKLKELPRLSLDSKASSLKGTTLESRSNYLRRDLQIENKIQEPESQHRTSNVVAKLMGLDNLPDTASMTKSRITKTNINTKEASLSRSSTTAEETKQYIVSTSPRASHNNSDSSPRLHGANSVRKVAVSPRFPLEPAPWRQQDSNQGSEKAATWGSKAATITTHPSPSVYGEIQKRITELEFRKSGKDLRALKQILEAMMETKDKLENQKCEPADLTPEGRYSLNNCFSKNSRSSMNESRKGRYKVTSITGAGPTKQTAFSAGTTIPGRVTRIQHLESIQTQGNKYSQVDSFHRQNERETSPRNKSLKHSSKHLPLLSGKTTCRTSELEENLKSPQRLKAETLTYRRSSGELSPRLRQNVHQIEDRSHASTPSPNSTKFKSMKVAQKASKHKKLAEAKYMELTYEQLSEFSSETIFSSNQGDGASVKSESNTSITSQTETEMACLPHSINTNARQLKEQPSPVSVLDATFYSEGSPSPVKKISTVFQDEAPNAGEEEWPFRDMKHIVQELRLLNGESHNTAENTTKTQFESHNPDSRYLNRTTYIPKANQIHPSYHLIHPDLYKLLEHLKEFNQPANDELIEKNHLKFDNEIDEKILLDMVNEVLVRKLDSGRLFAAGRKRISPEELMKEVHLEVERSRRLQRNKLDTIQEELTKLTNADMMYQHEDWTKFTAEIPAIVLDIERLVFKDLLETLGTQETLLLNIYKITAEHN